ncbi:MAG TPA: RNA polymerase sigma factor [Kofleriaceae bacterium]|nr:RNA polymerase sigma factor [Kofleriaceae bacterium]
MTGLATAEIEHTYRQYFQIVRAKCARMLRDPAEAQDVAQETFARLWIHRADINDANAVTAWLYRTSTRLAVDSYRRNRTSEPLDPDREDGGPAPAAADRIHAVRLLERIAGRAPARELEVAILSRLDELTHEEIAEVTGVSSRTVRRLLRRFDRRLARWSGQKTEQEP